jgi:hypothetical protein
MEQSSINQRIKFLIESIVISARAFSEIVGESPTNVHNYTGKRNSMPGADFLEKILSHFENVNPGWLVAGKGEPFLGDPRTGPTQTGNFNQSGTSNKQTIKGNKGNIQTGDGSTMHNLTLADCQNDLEKAQREIEYLRGQLQMQETVLAAKEETITLLRASFNRPN